VTAGLLCAVSVDLDEIHHYHDIHGLERPGPGGPGAHAVYDVGHARMDAFARGHDLPLTLFAIGEDLSRQESAASLRRLAAGGHTVENHSLSHRYDLTRAGVEVIRAEIEGGGRAIAEVTGRQPVGFRAPGYTITDEVFDVLEALEVRFDSSVFPCPAYWTAKAVVMASMRVRGRRSRSVLDTPGVLAAPARPYRPGTPYTRRGSRRLIELPIQVTPVLRLPVIGTSIALAGPTGARFLAQRCVGLPLVNLELHGIDFLAVEDGLEALRSRQPELGIPLERRLAALTAFVEALRDAGYSFVGLDEAAAHSAAGL
jgi:peptidoglycan-N-acetylglucosamine deacetylase